jgi:hypothetical protein
MDSIDIIINTLSDISKRQVELDEIKEKLSHTGKKCGNCKYWMTSYCKPEKENKEFKSMNSFACNLFIEDLQSKKFREEWESKLKNFNTK